MEPQLVCKIVIRKEDGGTFRVSGYLIAPNRIITVSHDVADAAPDAKHVSTGDARQISLSFWTKDREEVVDKPVYLEWCGTHNGSTIDVAVLRCDLPFEKQPVHIFRGAPLEETIEWAAYGYTDFGKRKREGRPDDYNGTVTKFTAESSKIFLTCTAGLPNPNEWKGGSGSVAFATGAKSPLAVITEFEAEGKKKDHLVAVPICYLLTIEEFRRAIQYERYAERENHCDVVRKVIAEQLSTLSLPLFDSLVVQISKLSGQTFADNPKEQQGARAERLAAYIVDHGSVTDMVRCLTGALRHGDGADNEKVAFIIDHILPLNYAPHTIENLREQIRQGKVGIVAGEVATRTLAEIIMAGLDGKPTQYIDVPIKEPLDVLGRTALNYQEGPEVGPELLPRVYDMLRDLETEKDMRIRPSVERPSKEPLVRLTNEQLVERIKACANSLRAGMKSALAIHGERRLYCVLGPAKNEPEQIMRMQVLEEVAAQVPGLLFVELIEMHKAKEQELETRDYVAFRLSRVSPKL